MVARTLLVASFLVVPLALLHVSGQDKPKDVIPHAQTKPPGPPLSPAEAITKMQVPPGFTVELVASEPDLVNPVAMHIDERGRFWVTESVEYPRRSPGPGQDRVKVIEVGPDGKASKVTTVIEGLNIPSGIAVGHGGVWLANAPDILFYPIEDFENLKLGKPKVIVTGFGRADTHELPNSFTWGPDGYLYGLNGVFNPSHVKQDEKEWKFTCALFRIHPVTKKFDVFCEGTSNPWGVAFNENGSAFVSACVIDHLWHLVETGYYLRQGGPYPPFTWIIGSIVKHKHQKAAYCGITWFDSDAYPEEYRGKLYMGNIHGNCINSDELTRDGSTYFGKPRPDFLTSNDAWFMPVVQKTGPDGSLYILDWYDRYHCYQDANRDPKGIDRLKGRLYRVRYKDTSRKTLNASAADDSTLHEWLGHPNIYLRETSQRMLAEKLRLLARKSAAIHRIRYLAMVGRLREAVTQDQSKTLRAHALWTLIAGGALEAEFHQSLLKHSDPFLRTWAVRALPREAKSLETLAPLARDPSADVRLQVAIAAGKIGDPASLPVLLDVLNHAGDDKLIPHIVWQNLHPLLEANGDTFLKLASRSDFEKATQLLNLMPRIVERILGAKKQDPQALVSLVEVLSRSPAGLGACSQVLATLGAKVQSGELTGESLKNLEGRLLPVAKKLQIGTTSVISLEAMLLAAALRDPASVADTRKLFATGSFQAPWRLKALDALIAGGDTGVVDLARTVLSDKSTPSTFRGQVLASLGKLDDPEVAVVVLKQYGSLESDIQPRAIELLTQRAAWSKGLLGEISKKTIPASALNVNQVRKMLASRDPELVKQVTSVWGTVREGRNPGRDKVVAEVREFAKKSPGEPQRGALVFKKLCAQCHKLHGEGADVGPDITNNGRSDYDQLLSNIFDPSLVIGAGYLATTVETGKGQVITGLLVEDSPQRVVLKTQGGKIETIARSDIEQVKTGQLSYMPEDVERQLSRQEIVDLLSYLALDRPPSDRTAKKIPGAP